MQGPLERSVGENFIKREHLGLHDMHQEPVTQVPNAILDLQVPSSDGANCYMFGCYPNLQAENFDRMKNN